MPTRKRRELRLERRCKHTHRYDERRGGARDDSGRTAGAEADRADEDAHGARRRRPAAARARMGQGGRAADPVHPRLVAEPSLLGQAGRELASPTSSGSSRSTCAAMACRRRRSSPSTTPTTGSGPTTSRRSSRSCVSTGRCWSAGRTARSSSATTCAPTARSESRAINFVEGAVKLGEAAFGTLIGPGFLDHFVAATADDLPTNIRGDALLRAGVRRQAGDRRRGRDAGRAGTWSCRPQIRANLAARELDCDDVLRALEVPLLVTPRPGGHGRAAGDGRARPRHLPYRRSLLVRRRRPRAAPRGARALQPRARRADPTRPRLIPRPRLR